MNRLIHLIIILTAVGALTAEAFVSSSTNYILQSDSVNFGGGFSSSSNLKLEDTLGEIATGFSASPTLVMSAGYQAMQADTFISVSAPVQVTMTPEINGVGGGTSDGSAVAVVQTNNVTGYELSARAAGSPALSTGAANMSDYLPSYGDPDFDWNTPEREARFGFSPEGDDISSAFRDDGVSCGTGAQDSADHCWIGFSQSGRVIASGGAATYPAGATTTIKLRAEVGAKKPQPGGTYRATIVLTASVL
jgi:hypothetical protein